MDHETARVEPDGLTRTVYVQVSIMTVQINNGTHILHVKTRIQNPEPFSGSVLHLFTSDEAV